jgi:hypothetical protein
MATITAPMTTAINAACLKINQRDPGASAVKANQMITAAFNDWPAATPNLWGHRGFDTAKMNAWLTWMTSLGVNVSALRTGVGL